MTERAAAMRVAAVRIASKRMGRGRLAAVFVACALAAAAACTSYQSENEAPPPGSDGGDAAPEASDDGGPDGGAADGPTSCGTSHDIAAEDASCGDLTVSNVNCGFCGHACVGSTCSSGRCLPFTLYPDAATAPNILNVWVIVGGEIVWSTSSGVVAAGILDGGSSRIVTTVGGTNIYGLLVDGSVLYALSRNGTIYEASLDGGGAPVPIVAYPADTLQGLTQDATYLYWFSSLERRIDRWAKGGASPPEPFQAVAGSSVAGLTTDGTDLFWIEESPSADAGTSSMLKRRTSDGNVVVRAADIGAAKALLVDATYVYWGVDGAILRATRTGSEPPETVATWAGSKVHVLAFALTANDVYWAAGDDSNAPNRDQSPAIYTSPKCGGIVRRLEDAVFLNGLIVPDSQYLYWTSFADVQRVAR
jgi:hypothetical protein